MRVGAGGARVVEDGAPRAARPSRCARARTPPPQHSRRRFQATGRRAGGRRRPPPSRPAPRGRRTRRPPGAGPAGSRSSRRPSGRRAAGPSSRGGAERARGAPRRRSGPRRVFANGPADELRDLRGERRVGGDGVPGGREAVVAGGAGSEHLVVPLLLGEGEVAGRERDGEEVVRRVRRGGAAARPVVDLDQLDAERAARRRAGSRRTRARCRGASSRGSSRSLTRSSFPRAATRPLPRTPRRCAGPPSRP